MKTKKNSPARDRILKTASELFYHNGYHQTGTNEIINKADVAVSRFIAKSLFIPAKISFPQLRRPSFFNIAL